MMPGIAIQPNFAVAPGPAVRVAPAPADDRFSQALRDKPSAPSQVDGKTSHETQNDAGNDSGRVDGSACGGKDGKAVGGTGASDDHNDGNEDDHKKDGDDKDTGALPPQMTAQRVLAGQWPASGPAAAPDGSATADGQGAPSAGTPALQGINAPQASGVSGVPEQAAIGVTGMAPATPPIGGTAAQLVVVATQPQPGTTPQPAKDGQPAVATTAAPDANDPIPGIASADAAITTQSAGAPAAFMAKVAALQHGSGPVPSPQGRSGVASTLAPAPQGEVEGKILQGAAGPGTGNAGADQDSQGGSNDGSPNKQPQGSVQSLTAAKGDTNASPLPTAQMVPQSGSAASFAGALAQGGRLARYAASAAAVAETGAPAGALPVQSLRIQLRPVELGTVTANLKYSGSQLTIDIEVQTHDAQRRLSSDSSDIVKSLQSLGFQVDKVTVRQVQPQTQAQSQGQSQGQPAGQDASAGRFGGQGSNPFSPSGNPQRQAGHHPGSESGNDDASGRDIGAVQQTADRRQPGRGVFI